MILQAILHEIGQVATEANIKIKPKVGDYGPCADAQLASFEPDVIIDWIDKKGKAWQVVLEFTRCLSEEEREQRAREEKKRQAYQGTVLHFQKLRSHVMVLQQTFVMSCHCTYLQNIWADHFKFWGMSKDRSRKAEKSASKREFWPITN